MFNASRPLTAVLAALLLAGCGQPVTSIAVPQGSAEEAGVAAHVSKHKVTVDEYGIRVSALPKASASKAVTYVSYKAAENSLSPFLDTHLNLLERAGSTAQTNVLALTDGEGDADTRRYYIQPNADLKTLLSPYMADGRGGELDTGDAASLKRTLSWAQADYPAKFRWVDLNSHGGGFAGIAPDERSNSLIQLPQLATALETGSKIDLLTFDACIMASVEVAYELRSAAKVMIASEDDSYALGMNTDKALASMAKRAPQDPVAVARELVIGADRKSKEQGFGTISAIDLSKADTVKAAVDLLAKALLKAMPAHKSAIKLSLGAVKPFAVAGKDQVHRDLHEVVVQLRQRVQEAGVQSACQAVQSVLFNRGGAIIISRARNDQNKVPRGLSIYLPTNGEVDPGYRKTDFAKSTQWDELLSAL